MTIVPMGRLIKQLKSMERITYDEFVETTENNNEWLREKLAEYDATEWEGMGTEIIIGDIRPVVYYQSMLDINMKSLKEAKEETGSYMFFLEGKKPVSVRVTPEQREEILEGLNERTVKKLEPTFYDG